MRGKNSSRNNLWERSDKSNLHYKMYKVGKKWVFASLFMLSLGSFMLTDVSVRADTQDKLNSNDNNTRTALTATAADPSSQAPVSEAADTTQEVSTTAEPVQSAASKSDAVVAPSSDGTAHATGTTSAASQVSSTGSNEAMSDTQQTSIATGNESAASSEATISTSASEAAPAASTTPESAATSTAASDNAVPTSDGNKSASSSKSSVPTDSNVSLTEDAKKADSTASDLELTDNGPATAKATTVKLGQRAMFSAPADDTGTDDVEAVVNSYNELVSQGKITDNTTMDVTALSDDQLKALKAAIVKSGKTVTLAKVDATAQNLSAAAVDTSSPSYQMGYTDAWNDLKNGTGKVPTIADIVDAYNNSPLVAGSTTEHTMLNADGTPAWTGRKIPATDGVSITWNMDLIGTYPLNQKGYWKLGSTFLGNNKTLTLSDYRAGYAAYVKDYAKQMVNFMTQVQNQVQNPDNGDKLVNTTKYNSSDLTATSDIWSIFGTAITTVIGKLLNVLGQKDVTSSNPAIFGVNTNSSDSTVNDLVKSSVTTINGFIALALPYIQNGIMNQALSDIRSFGGSQGSQTDGFSVTLPATLTEAMNLNAPLQKLASAFGFGNVISSTIVNNVYLSIAKGVRTAINSHFQTGLDAAVANIMNGTVPAIDYTKVTGYSTTDIGKFATTNQNAGDITKFVEAIGYAYGQKLVPAILKMAVNNVTSNTGTLTARQIVDQLHADKVISDTEYTLLTTPGTTGTDSAGNPTTKYSEVTGKVNYQANPTGAMNTILAIYNAEVNAINQAKADFAANPNTTIDSSKVQFVNQGTAGNNVYDSKTGTMTVSTAITVNAGDYAKILAYLQSSDAAKQGQADADVTSHDQKNGQVVDISTTDKTFKGDTSLLSSDQLKNSLDAIVQSLGQSASSTLGKYYIESYNAEAKLANAAFAAGQQAANEQAKSDYFKKNGTLPTATVGDDSVSTKVGDVTYSGANDGTASDYSSTSGLGGFATGTAFVDGYVKNTQTAIKNALNDIYNDTHVQASNAASDASRASDAAESANAYASAASDAALVNPNNATVASDAKVASDAAVSADEQATVAKKGASDAAVQEKITSDAAAGDGNASDASDAKAAADKAERDRDNASNAAKDANNGAIESLANSAASDATSRAASAASDAKVASDAAVKAASDASAASDAAVKNPAAQSDANKAASAASDAKKAAESAISDASKAASAADKANAAASDAQNADDPASDAQNAINADSDATAAASDAKTNADAATNAAKDAN
ncbi:KxYKxGKxW signal peptide domain-containing protein, partial [Lentilactobacillus kisonensis]|uniref:KxYKxGKxW signal peptide domain-containing protein n=1 Tax=Lentilactobacillus kisonensis TaxID=481722 RepID=UPI000AD83E0E